SLASGPRALCSPQRARRTVQRSVQTSVRPPGPSLALGFGQQSYDTFGGDLRLPIVANAQSQHGPTRCELTVSVGCPVIPGQPHLYLPMSMAEIRNWSRLRGQVMVVASSSKLPLG